MNLVINVLEYGSLPKVTCRLTVSSRLIESLVNPVSEDDVGGTLLVDNPSF